MEREKLRAVVVREAAELLGVSPGHVSLVARGLRASARLAGRMRALGIAPADGRRLARRAGRQRSAPPAKGRRGAGERGSTWA